MPAPEPARLDTPDPRIRPGGRLLRRNAKPVQSREPDLAPAPEGVLSHAGKPVRHRDREPASDLATEALDGNLVITADRVMAWFRLPLQRWSFRPEGERLAVVAAAGMRLSQLTRRRCHIRVTSRPFDSMQWAAALDQSVRGLDAARRPSRQVMPGPCDSHPYLSNPSCPACVPGHAWIDWVQSQQSRLRQWGIADRDVYIGVEVTSRGTARRLLEGWGRAVNAERAALAGHAAVISNAVRGAGLGARPVTPEELQWLYIRSTGMHLPAPRPFRERPAPFPFALAPSAPAFADHDAVSAYADDFPWTAEPFGSSVQVTRAADGTTAYVTVLTVTDMTGPQDMAPESPWMQRTDQLSFPVEWSVVFDVLDPRVVKRIMSKQAEKITAQYKHIVDDHGQAPPVLLAEQLDAVRRIQAEALNADANGTYVWAWPRIAVAGQTPEQARARAAEVAELYAPGIIVKQPPDQYRLLREFIPGEPLASTANRRLMHAELLTAGMPAVTAQVGHFHGFPLGVTSRMSCRAVTFDPHHAMEYADRSGLVAVTGAPGGGKSTLAGLFGYMNTRAGIATTALDPSGMLTRLCAIPALRKHALAVDLLQSPPGTLCPYRLIAEPKPEDFDFDDQGQRRDPALAERAWWDACRSAEAQRRALTEGILKMLLPERVLNQDGTEDAINAAVNAAPASTAASPRDVIAKLYALDESSLADRGRLLARRLEGIADHPLTRLFFPPQEEGADLPIGSHLLTVMTLRGLIIPAADRRPEDRSPDEQLSIPVLHLAAQLLRRQLLDLPRGTRKAAILDEAHALVRDSVGRQQMNEMARDSRKNNLFALLLSQNPQDLLAAGLANLIGAAFVFRTDGEEEQSAACRLLGLEPGRGYETRLSELSSASLAGGSHTGECLFRDGQGGLEQVQIDIGPDPDLWAALNTTPGGGRATAAAQPAPAYPGRAQTGAPS